MIILLFIKVFSVFLVCAAVHQFATAKRQGMVEAHHYWFIGMAGYDLVLPWTTGFLAMCVYALFVICMLGTIVGLGESMLRSNEEDRRVGDVRRNALVAKVKADISRSQEARTYDCH